MSYTYADRRRTPSAPAKQNTDAQSPAAEALRSGAAAPTQEQMGRRVDLPDAMRAKMEASFGADLSAVKLYESEAVADAGAEAVTQGSNIAFAPGMLDFSSFGGQSLLGHEISHVVSQARGEVAGGGFLSDHTLEARADREGAMAAAGQQIAAPTAAISGVSAASAAGPMQAKKKKQEPEYAPFQKLKMNKVGKLNLDKTVYDLRTDSGARATEGERAGFSEEMLARFNSDDYEKGSFGDISNGSDIHIRGLGLNRMAPMLEQSMGEGYSRKHISDMYDDLMAPHRTDLNRSDPEAMAAANGQFDRGMRTLKEMHYRKLKRLEATYGKLGSQMHPEDFVRLAGDSYNDHFHMVQDTEQFLKDGGKYFDFEHDEKDREFKALHDYYYTLTRRNAAYGAQEIPEIMSQGAVRMDPEALTLGMAADDFTPEMEAAVHGPSLSEKEQAKYMRGLHARARKGNWTNRLFGKFR